MMRSGLEKPGAIPFLALVVFSLLSLVPSLSGDWGYHWKNGYGSEVRPMGADFSRIVKDAPVDTRLRVRATSGQYWPWLCGDLLSHSRPPAVPSSFEFAPVIPNDYAPTVYPWKNSSTLTRSVRAFTTFFIQRLDDHQLLPSFSSRSVSPVETAPSHPPSNVSSSPLHPSRDDSFEQIEYDYNYTTLMTTKTDTNPELQFCDHFSGAWQRACRIVHDTVKTFSTSYDAIDSTHLPNSSTYAPDSPSSDTPTHFDLVVQPKVPLLNDEIKPTVALKTKPSANAAAVLSGDSQDAGTSRNPKQVRGSCMAIVIGLVVGIMWF